MFKAFHITTNIMKVVYSFYGKLPTYAVPTVKQMRMFYAGDIYFIVSDMENPLIQQLKDMNVIIVDYKDVEDTAFTELQTKQYKKFCYCDTLIGREELFIRSMERFYLLHNLMIKESLTDVFFVELDNLVYNNPESWLGSFSKKDMAYMFDNVNRCSTGICYVKNTTILKKFMDLMTARVECATEFLNEMTFLYYFWLENTESVQLLPTHWPAPSIPQESYDTFSDYDGSIFDSLPIGIYLTGIETIHSNNVLTRGIKCDWSAIDFTRYVYYWRKDDLGRFIPYVNTGTHEIRINNLHVHSKDILPYLSDAIVA
jgi:hypothetical protein